MQRNSFKVLVVDVGRKTSKVMFFGKVNELVGGTGLAAGLFAAFGLPNEPADHPDQPVIFAIGPLTGYFPLMSKVVMGFKSPLTGHYAESHAGGRLALALRFCGYDALVIKGRASRLSCLSLGSRSVEIKDVHYLRGRDVFSAGKMLRRIAGGSGHRSIMRIGPAGENGVKYACINVDSFRHFGRLGSGAALGYKNLKAIAIAGDGSLALPESKAYPEVFAKIYEEATASNAMKKYHDLGTAENLAVLNGLKALPWRNLTATTDERIDQVSGEKFAKDLLLRNTACAGCPVGCIHVGLLREKFGDEYEYLYRQVAYDYEPIFAVGTMLGMTTAPEVMTLMEDVERLGVDVMSAGVCLAWATEAFERGLITEELTMTKLAFDDLAGYRAALKHISAGTNEFYVTLGQGAKVAAQKYGGSDFACVLGQEMAGYATGEAFFVSQAYGFRHSHLDSGGYSLDQEPKQKSPEEAVAFFVSDEAKRIGMTSMVACLFSRKIYSEAMLKDCLTSVGYAELAERLPEACDEIQALRWTLKLRTGFDPTKVVIPKRFLEVVTWRGSIDPIRLQAIAQGYTQAILSMAEKGRARLEQGFNLPKDETQEGE